jgi:hypothetical protein
MSKEIKHGESGLNAGPRGDVTSVQASVEHGALPQAGRTIATPLTEGNPRGTAGKGVGGMVQ